MISTRIELGSSLSWVRRALYAWGSDGRFPLLAAAMGDGGLEGCRISRGSIFPDKEAADIDCRGVWEVVNPDLNWILPTISSGLTESPRASRSA